MHDLCLHPRYQPSTGKVVFRFDLREIGQTQAAKGELKNLSKFNSTSWGHPMTLVGPGKPITELQMVAMYREPKVSRLLIGALALCIRHNKLSPHVSNAHSVRINCRMGAIYIAHAR